jgi:glycosyltransferase involved in cell wall biosynthesis
VRILRIDSWDGPPGGAQDYVREVTSELAARGHESRVLQLTDGPPVVPPPTGVAFPPERRRPMRFAGDLVHDAALDDRLAEHITAFDPDVVSLHHFDAHFTTVARVLSRLHAPLVFAGHDAELVCPISTLVQPGGVVCDGGVRFRCLFTGCRVGAGGAYNLWQARVFDRQVRPHVRAYLCPSRSLRDYLVANGYAPAIHLPSFARIPEPVRQAPPPPPPAGTPPTIGYLGRLEWYKGVHDLLRALPLLHGTAPDVRLDIAGDGPFRPELERLAASLGLSDRVRFRGRVEGHAKEEWFAGVHLLATPSNMWENFPLVALEGLVRGRPVVATNIGGIPDIVEDGETGFLVPIERPDALAARLGTLLGDPARARAMGLLGRARVLDRFTPEGHVTRLVRIYRSIVDGRPPENGGPAEATGGSGR